MKILQLSCDDAPFLAVIDKICMSVPWTEKMFFDDLSNPMTFYMGIYHGDKLTAYGGMWLVADEAQITNIAVLPEYRRRGLGNMIISQLKTKAKKTAEIMLLEVRESNASAISLYKKNGFVQYTTRRNYYKNPVEDAVLMQYRFNNC